MIRRRTTNAIHHHPRSRADRSAAKKNGAPTVQRRPPTFNRETDSLMSPARPSGPARLATYFHVHLVSDSTGETLNAMAKAVKAPA